jgi:hypothetical protein
MANYIYGAVALNGGGTGSLDSIDGTDLAQGDAAIVFTSDATYIYTLDESSGGTESSPDLITPDTNEANKRWVLVSSRAAESSLDYSSFNGILDANDDDVQKALNTIDDMFDSGDFTISPGQVLLDGRVIKNVITDSGTVTISSHQLDLLGQGKVNTTGSGRQVTFSVDDLAIVTKTSSYSITADDDIVIGDCSGGDITLTLPQASTKSAITIFKKSSSNTLTVACYGSETIESNASYDINDEYGALRLVSDDTNTWVTSSEMFDLPTATASILGAIKVGDNLEMNGDTLNTNLSAVNEDIIPDADVTRSLGTAAKQWKDVFVGPGSLYVNGQQVVSDNSGTIVMSADADQNIQVQSKGTGDIELLPSGSGVIQMKGNFSVLAGKNMMSSDGNAISFTDGIDMNGNRLTGLPAPTTDSDVATRLFAKDASNLTTGTIPAARMPQTYAIVGNNLSDLTNATTARTNIGLSNVPNVNTTNASNITTGTLPSSVLPPIAITTTQVASSEAAQLALVTQQGDVVVRTDLNRSYIDNGGTAGTMADFTELSTPVDSVLSVNGETGTVILNQDEIGDGTTYVRTQNDFTDPLLTKLNGIEAGADVNPTNSEVKTAYEANANTNAFTDALQTKLNGIESSATADMTAAEILTAIKTVDGPGSGLNADVLDNMSSSTAATGSTIVARDAEGDINVRYATGLHMIMSHAQATRNSDTIFYSSDDTAIRKNTAAGFKASLDLDNVDNIGSATGATGDTLVLRDASGNTTSATVNATNVIASNMIKSDMYASTNASQLAIAAGESYTQLTVGNIGTAETVWLGGENGVKVVSSPDNWTSSWAGRHEATILDSSGNSSFPGTITAALSGNASTATTLQTARSINGVSFNGSANIIVDPYISDDDTGDTNCPLTFTANTTAGYKRLYEDSSLYFDNTNNRLYAPAFYGTSTSSRYADLAEKHTCENKALITGTVICACSQGEYEAEECMTEKASNVIGVVSEKAGYIMNEDLEDSIIVGLTGKVPVRIVGEVKKGQPIVSAGNGCARQAITEMELLYKMGVALEDNSDMNEKLVYCAIK